MLVTVAVSVLIAVPRAALAAPPATDQQVLGDAKVGTDTPALLGWLRRQTTTPAKRASVRSMIRKLGSDDYATREAASRGLLESGPAALAHLRSALNDPDEEIKERVRAAIAALEPKSKPAVTAAAARLLRNRRGAEVLRALIECLADADGEVEDEVLASVAVVGVEDGKVASMLADGQRDKDPGVRAAAALVLGRSGSAEQQATVRAMAEDADSRVRLRAAQGLLVRRDPAALTVLVGLVGDAPASLAVRADELLAAVARNHASRLAWADDAMTRRRCRSAWENWLRFFGRADLTSADVDLPPWNRTLQAAAVSRSMLVALIQNDRDRFNKLAAVPFLGPGDRIAAKVEEAEGMLRQLAATLAQESPVPPPVPSVRFFQPDTLPPSAAVKALLARVPKTEVRGVRLAWRAPEPARDVHEIIVVVRTISGRPQVIAVNPQGIAVDPLR
jgi:hypothetical protein